MTKSSRNWLELRCRGRTLHLVLNPLWLETLRVVVETGSFAAAARRLGYTPSAISQQMAGLERQVNAVLFERVRSGIKPTPTALRLVERATPLLVKLAELDSDLREAELAPGEPLRMGSFPAGVRHLLPAVRRLAAGPVPVSLSLAIGQPRQLVAAVYAGPLEVALVERYDLVPRTWPAEVAVRPIADEAMVLLLRAEHPLAGEGRIPVGDLPAETWVAGSPDGDDCACLFRLCAAAGFRPRVLGYSEDPSVQAELVRARVGIALVPSTDEPPEAGLVRVPLAGMAPRRRVELAYRAAGGSAAVAALTAALRA
ncbi:MAG: hypothetical protein V7637_1007 [Mycobacteriales bacterium]|jgi:DNA-binding transcriptional LysR family regulator